MGIRCGGVGVVSELERAAMNGEPMPEGLCQIDQSYFQGLSLLYARFRSGLLSREAGSAEKKMLQKSREDALRERQFGERCMDHAMKLWQEVEGAANQYARERTLEHADQLYQAVYGVPVPKEEAV